MSHAPLVWELTVTLVVAMLLFDYFFHIRTPHVPTLAEAARWSGAYIAVAILFGGAVWAFGGRELGIQYFAGYLTEKELLIGIVIALLARSGFIFAGAALIEHFAWVFYIFGVILLLTAGHMLTPD